MAYRVVLSDQATYRLEQSYVGVRTSWVSIAKRLATRPEPADLDPIRCMEVASDYLLCAYDSPTFPYIVLYTVERLPYGADAGVVAVRRFLDRPARQVDTP